MRSLSEKSATFRDHALATEEIIESRDEAVAAHSDSVAFGSSCSRRANGGGVDVVAPAEIGVH